MIRRVKHATAVVLAVAGTAFAVVALSVASAAPAGAASVSRSRVGPDFTCPTGAVCTYYGEKYNNSPHTWWPANKSEKWYKFSRLHVNNPGSLRNKSSYCVWVGTKPGGIAGPDFRSAPGNTPGSGIQGLHHNFGWFYITGKASCGPQPPDVKA